MIRPYFFNLVWVIITAFCGMIAIGGCFIGFWYRKLNIIERLLSLAGGLLLIYPEGISDIIGLCIFVGMIVLQFLTKQKDKNMKTPASA